MDELLKYATIFFKASQAVAQTVDAGTTITDKDKNALKEHVAIIQKASKTVQDWVNRNVSPNNTDTRLMELKRFIDSLNKSSQDLFSKTNQFLTDNSSNKNINSIEPSVTAITQNYNAIRPAYITEDWMQRYISSEEAKAMTQIKDSINFIESFITKQKNQQATTGSDTPLPNLNPTTT